MTTRDGIGSPRRREVVERDARALKLIRDRERNGHCTRLSDVRTHLVEVEPGLTRGQCYYVLKRLESAGHIERKAGYIWCVREQS